MAYSRARLILQLLLPAAYFMAMSLPAAAALSFSYNFSKPGDLEAAKLTYINVSSSSGDRVSLTANTTGSTGRVAYPRPVRLWDDRTGRRASFTTNFTFFIGNGSVNSSNEINGRGDGMAFFVGPFPATLPVDSDGAFLGLFSNNTKDPSSSAAAAVAVEFDTYKNHGLDPPNVTADHIGIDVDNITSANYTALPNLALSGVMSASIRYDAGSKMMSVSLWLADGSLYTVQARVDLKDALAGPDAAVGFSAATGIRVESHQLLSWSFSSTDPSKIEPWVIILIAFASATLVSLMATLLCIIMLRRPSTPGLFRDKSIVLPVARKFGYKQLSRATKHFSKDNLLGAGSFGEVYQGELRVEQAERSFVAKLCNTKRLRDDPCMRLVAVKKLKQHAEQFRKDYVSEIEILGQLNHRNLVKLVGWCDGGADKQLLVYELVNNGSVDEHLHGPGRPPLGWPERYKIALGVGRAIEYLHTGCHNNLAVLHRDIKPSNVLLDEGFEAQLGDFGLVRRVNPGQSSLGGTRMIGTLAYIDPMCATTSTVSTASDMYSFGVMLLEIATGKKLVETSDARDLIEDVQKCYHNDTVLDMPDKRLSLDDLDERRQVERILAVGLLCAQHERQFRPEITIVVKLLSDLSHPLPAPGVRNDSSAELQI